MHRTRDDRSTSPTPPDDELDDAVRGRMAELEDEVRRLQRRVAELERFEQLVERMPFNTVIVEADNDDPEPSQMAFVWANQAAYTRSASDLAAAMHVPLSEVSMAIDMSDAIEACQQALRRDDPTRVPVMTVATTDGTESMRSYDVTLVPLAPHALAVFYHDVTDQQARRCEDELRATRLRRAEREQRMFASMAAHDLQAPLRAVRGYLQALDEDAGSRLTHDERILLQRAVQGAERMRRLIDALLEFSRIEANAIVVEQVELDELLDELLDALESELRDTRATLTRAPMPTVTGFRPLLTVLFQNLLINALKYCGDAPPRIDLSSRRDGDRWVISVRDEGIGIPPQVGDGIFQPFGRAHDRSVSGSGLGLAVVMRSVQRMNGHVWYDAEVGGGTTFHVALPVGETEM